MKKHAWRIMSASLVMILALVGGVYFFDSGRAAQAIDEGTIKGSDKKQSLPAVRVEIVRSSELLNTIVLTGSVVPTRVTRLASMAEGPVETCLVSECMVREGDRVTEGQLLLQIGRNKTVGAQLAAARQSLEEQEQELARIEQLVEAGALPGAQLDVARSRYENARAQFTKTMESSQDYLVMAPWDGIVAGVFVTEGDLVSPRTPLIEIFDPDSLVVRFAVPETSSTDVRDGMTVEVQLDAHPGKRFPGTVSRVYPQLDKRTRTRRVEATLSVPVDLIPGMFARIQVVLARIPDAVTVPTYSLVAMPDGGYAAFVVENGKALRRAVEIGREVNGRVEILFGVHAGERVVVAGHEKLKDGVMVQALSTATPTAATVHDGDRP